MANPKGISAVITGVPELQARFKLLRSVPAQKDALAEAMAGRLQQRIQFRFDQKVDPEGNRWVPILPSTIDNLTRRASLSGNGSVPGSLLNRTDPGLRSSLTRAKISGGWAVGFGRPYAVYHEFGAKYMQRRGLIFSNPETGQLSPADLAALLKTGDQFLRQIGAL